MLKRAKRIPKFASEAEERQFWETHDTEGLIDWSKARRVRFPNLKPSTKSISLRLPLGLLEQIKVEGDVKQLSSRLKRKADLLKRASAALLDTAKLGVAEWTTASLYQVGAIYESFAKSLVNSPPPSNLTAEQAEEYRMQIDEFVVPIEEKSIEAYESGWNKALELGIFNAWTAKMREALGRLNGEMFPPLSEVGFRLRSEDSGRLPQLITATRRTDAGASREYLMAAPAPATFWASAAT